MSRQPSPRSRSKSSSGEDGDQRGERARGDHGYGRRPGQDQSTRDQGGEEPDHDVGSMADREHNDSDEGRGDREIDPETAWVADRTPPAHADNCGEAPQPEETEREGEVIRRAP